jgi:uncharacterized membrane protein
MQKIVFIVGVVATLMGLLWIGQGSGYITWPQSSFMIDQRPWIYYGAGLALVGVFMMGFGRARS